MHFLIYIMFFIMKKGLYLTVSFGRIDNRLNMVSAWKGKDAMKNKNWKFIIIILFIMISGGCYSLGATKDMVPLETKPTMTEASPDALPEAEASGAETAAGEQFFYVHICGAVRQAGVYQVPAGERIFRVVELAGGYTPDAADEYLNLAAEVTDGLKLIVPTREEYDRVAELARPAAGDPAAADQDLRVNLNTATKEQLMGLSGIGEAKAEAILRYRDEKGTFRRIEDIMNIPGIKQAAFDKIKDGIVVLN